MEPMGRVKGLGVSGFGVSELMLLGCITLFFDGQWGGVGWGGGGGFILRLQVCHLFHKV